MASTAQVTVYQLSSEAGKTVYMAKKTERLLKDCITKFCLHNLEADDDFLSRFINTPDYKKDVMVLYGKLLQYRLNDVALQRDEWTDATDDEPTDATDDEPTDATDDGGCELKPGAKRLVGLMINSAQGIIAEHNLNNNDTAFLYFREISDPRLNIDIIRLRKTNRNQYDIEKAWQQLQNIRAARAGTVELNIDDMMRLSKRLLFEILRRVIFDGDFRLGIGQCLTKVFKYKSVFQSAPSALIMNILKLQIIDGFQWLKEKVKRLLLALGQAERSVSRQIDEKADIYVWLFENICPDNSDEQVGKTRQELTILYKHIDKIRVELG